MSVPRSVWVGAAVALAAGCGSDDGGGSQQGLGTGGCLSDEQICSLHKGVTTKDDVQKSLGNAQEFLGSDTWVYVCQLVSGQEIVHNDQVIVSFDSSGLFNDATVLRQGTGATPPPDCKMTPGATGSCASVPRPAPDTAVCQAVVFGTTTTTCTDPQGRKWGETCQGTTCNCTYNDQNACTCTVPSGGRGCCPGQPGAP